MTRLTVNLTDRANADLAAQMAMTGPGKTDTVNRALSVSAFVQAIVDSGSRLMIVHEDGTQERICLL